MDLQIHQPEKQPRAAHLPEMQAHLLAGEIWEPLWVETMSPWKGHRGRTDRHHQPDILNRCQPQDEDDHKKMDTVTRLT